MAVIRGFAFGVVLAWGLATVVFDAMRMRKRDPLRTPGAAWWRVLVEVKSQPVDTPLFTSGFLLIFIGELAAHASTWWLALSLPLGAMQVWYLRRYPDPWTRHGLLRPVAPLDRPKPAAAERHVPLLIQKPKKIAVTASPLTRTSGSGKPGRGPDPLRGERHLPFSSQEPGHRASLLRRSLRAGSR